jgi:hypothetical protein
MISGEVFGDEICFTKPSVDLEPFKSEHEGYTGNAGNTVDRWYHRAAVLLWPRTRTFAIRAKASPAWGIREIAKALARGRADVARQRIGELLPFWSSVVPGEKAPVSRSRRCSWRTPSTTPSSRPRSSTRSRSNR